MTDKTPNPTTDANQNRQPAGKETFPSDAAYQNYITVYNAQKANNEKGSR